MCGHEICPVPVSSFQSTHQTITVAFGEHLTALIADKRVWTGKSVEPHTPQADQPRV